VARVSDRVTSVDAPVPDAVTVTVNVAVAPDVIGPLPLFATVTSARSQLTTEIDSVFEVAVPAVDDVAVAMFVRTPQLPRSVEDVR